jgi:hypothetical protein
VTRGGCSPSRSLHLLRLRLDEDDGVPPLAGVDVPGWIENELRYAEDTVDASLEHAESTALELMAFCRRLGLPFGINIESVSIRKVEIEASVRLAEHLRGKLAH